MPSYHRLHNEAPERVAMFSFASVCLVPVILGGRLDMGKFAWFRRNHPGCGNGVFRIAINKTRIGGAEYLVSDSKTGCLRADLLDRARNLRAERQRQGQASRFCRFALAHPMDRRRQRARAQEALRRRVPAGRRSRQ